MKRHQHERTTDISKGCMSGSSRFRLKVYGTNGTP